MTVSNHTRRNALKLAGSALAGVGIVGRAGALSTETVRVNVGYSTKSGRQAAQTLAVEVVHRFHFDALTILAPQDALDALAGRDDIRYVEEDSRMEAIAQTLPWGIDRVDAEVAHENGETGAGADLAIIDTGIDSTHPDLQANLGEGKAFVAGTGHPVWQDDNGHGTHVAGTADAVNNSQGVVGVSTEATLHAVKVLTGVGIGFTSDVAKGIEYTADQGWDVGNLSLGGGDSKLLRDAVEYAYARGVLLVAAAGNEGECTDCVAYPAAYPECIAVSATARDDSLAGFSSTGPEVELAAPGEDIYSTFLGGSYATLSGTSMASPHVAGAGGQLMANGYTNTEAREQLNRTAEDIGLASSEQGNGLVDVAAALGLDSSDDLDGNSEGGTAPTGTITDVTETETPSPHAEFDVSWRVNDDDGDLDSVTLTLRDTTADEFEDSTTVSVEGTDASDTTALKAHKDDGSGHEYEVRLHVRDSNGNSDTDSVTISESEYSTSHKTGRPVL